MKAVAGTVGGRLGRVRPRAPDRGTLAAIGASVALGAIVVGCLAVVLSAVRGRSFLAPTLRHSPPDWMTWPFGGLWSGRTQSHTALEVRLLVALLAMTACYLAAVWLAPRLRPAVVGAFVVVTYGIMFLSPPLLLTDVFNYVDYARMGVLHGINPYTHVPAMGMRHDAAWKLSNWHHLRSPYGPGFTLMTYALAPLGIAGAYWGYKALLLVVSLACAWLVGSIARRLGLSPTRAVVLVALNPLVLVYGAGGQHMDPFDLVFVLAAIHLGTARREAIGAAAIAAAAAVKASAAALVPVAVAGLPRRRSSLFGFAVAFAVIGAAVLVAFGPHPPAVGAQSRLVTPYSIPNVLGWMLGQGGENGAVRAASQAVLAASVVGCTVWAWRTRDMLVPLGWLTLATLVTLGWDMAWYLLWLLPFIAFVRGRAFRIAALVLAAWLTLQWLPLASSAVHAVGFKPSGSPVWKQNRQYVRSLLH